MASQEPTKVLVVIGEQAFAVEVEKSLTHPRLQVETAVAEPTIVSALTSRQYDLVVVGGHVGKRGPLVLCDVVRLRQSNAAVLVLLRDETDEGQLAAHMARQLPRVQYVDLRGVAAALERGARLRAMALGLMQLEEDPDSGQRWPLLLTAPAAQPETADSYLTEAAEPLPGDSSHPAALPAADEAITDDDLAFAARILARTQGVDFRSPLAPTPVPEGTDRATAKLRDRVRELERHLARLAHLYAGRQREFDAADGRVAQAEAQRQSLEQDLQRLHQHFDEERERWRGQRGEREIQLDGQARRAEAAEARLQEAAEEVARLREQGKAQEAAFAGMLKQAQDAFTQLREQSAQALAFYERRVGEQDKQAQATAEEAAQLRTAHQEATTQITTLTRELEQRAQLAGQAAALETALATERAATEHLHIQVGELETHLAGVRAQLSVATTQAAEQVESTRRELQAAVDAKSAALAKAESELASVRAALDARTSTVGEREREVATLAARLESRDREVTAVAAQLDSREKEAARLAEAERGVREELERAKERALERALDARLTAVEEHARLAAESGSRIADFLTAFEQRAAKQATLVDRLLRIIEPPEGAGGGHVAPVVAARRLAERLRPESPRDRLGRWLREHRWPLVAALVVVVILGLAAVFGLTAIGRDAPVAALQQLERALAAPAATKSEPAASKQRKGAGAADPGSTASVSKPETGDAAVAGDPGQKLAPEDQKPAPEGQKPAPEGQKPAPEGQKPAPEGQKPAPVATASKSATAEAAPLAVPLSAEERKNLRRRLFDAHKAKKWAEAADAGLALRAAGRMDWEAELRLAQALRDAGRTEEAIEVFRAFLEEYPENKFAAEAQSWLEKLSKR